MANSHCVYICLTMEVFSQTDVGGHSMTHRLNTIIKIIFLLIFCFSYGQIQPFAKEQARNFVARLKSNEDYPIGGKDRMIALNANNFEDILIEFRGLAGTGEKNGVIVIYTTIQKKFVPCEQLNYLANPTF